MKLWLYVMSTVMGTYAISVAQHQVELMPAGVFGMFAGICFSVAAMQLEFRK